MSRIQQLALLAAKVLGLTVLLVIVSGVGARWLPTAEIEQQAAAGPPPGSFLALVLAIFFLQVAVLAYPIVRSRWHGWRLALTIGVVYFGSVTFLNQIESLVYLGDKMPEGMLGGLFAMGLLNAVVLAPIGVLVLGKWTAGASGSSEPAPMWPRRLAAKVAGVGLIYLAFYYLFGYYVAWQSPVLREYYGGTDPGSFFAQMVSVAQGQPWMLPFQYLRGLLWTGLALLVVRSMKGRWWEAGLALSALFAVPALYLLFPNQLMPGEVRMTHLIETLPYQFVFGWLAAWILGSQGLKEGTGAEPARGEAAVQAT